MQMMLNILLNIEYFILHFSTIMMYWRGINLALGKSTQLSLKGKLCLLPTWVTSNLNYGMITGGTSNP